MNFNLFGVFLDDNPVAKAVILSAMKEWEESSCLKFVQRTDEADYLEFFQGSGSVQKT